MPTTNPENNREYVKASNMKKKEQLIRTKGQEEGVMEYNGYFANNQQKYRDNKKETEEKAELYKKQQAEYMKQYRATKKALKLDVEKKQKSVNTLTDAIKARRARNELQTLAIEQANKTADKLTEIGKTAKEIIESGKKKSHKKKKRGKKSK
jgi:hypothetical protein